MPKISELPALTTANNNDAIAIVETSTATTKRITRGDLLKSPLPANAVNNQAIAEKAVTADKIDFATMPVASISRNVLVQGTVVNLKRVGNTVTATIPKQLREGEISETSNGVSTSTLPVGWRPLDSVVLSLMTQVGARQWMQVIFQPNGTINWETSGINASSYWSGSASWITLDQFPTI